MRFGDILRLCRQNLWRRKSRTILTVLGVIVGCSSIVLMVSLGQGINEQNEKMLKSMGDLSIVTVYTNGYAGPMGGGGSSEMGDTKLDDKAVESFRAMSGVSGVTPMMNFPYNVTARAGAGGRYIYDYVQIMGIDMTQFDQMGYKLVGGEKPVKKDQVLAGEWFAYGFMDTLKNGEQRTSTRGDQYSSCTFDQTTGQCEEDRDEDPFFDPLATQISRRRWRHRRCGWQHRGSVGKRHPRCAGFRHCGGRLQQGLCHLRRSGHGFAGVEGTGRQSRSSRRQKSHRL